MERLLAAVIKLLEAVLPYLKPVFDTVAAFFLGKGLAEYQEMEAKLREAQHERELLKDLSDFHDGLSDGGLRDVTAQRIERIKLRLKARAAGAGGGYDD
jgi:hypothetical protein